MGFHGFCQWKLAASARDLTGTQLNVMGYKNIQWESHGNHAENHEMNISTGCPRVRGKIPADSHGFFAPVGIPW